MASEFNRCVSSLLKGPPITRKLRAWNLSPSKDRRSIVRVQSSSDLSPQGSADHHAEKRVSPISPFMTCVTRLVLG